MHLNFKLKLPLFHSSLKEKNRIEQVLQVNFIVIQKEGYLIPDISKKVFQFNFKNFFANYFKNIILFRLSHIIICIYNYKDKMIKVNNIKVRFPLKTIKKKLNSTQT